MVTVLLSPEWNTLLHRCWILDVFVTSHSLSAHRVYCKVSHAFCSPQELWASFFSPCKETVAWINLADFTDALPDLFREYWTTFSPNWTYSACVLQICSAVYSKPPHCIAGFDFLVMAKYDLEKAGCKGFICLNKGFVIPEFSPLSYAINDLLRLLSEIWILE